MAKLLSQLLLFVVLLTNELSASTSGFDRVMNAYFPEKKTRMNAINYFGLRFAIDEASVSCQTNHDSTLVCKTNQGADIIFEKSVVTSKGALSLLKQNRKQAWAKKFPSLNQYVELTIKVFGQPIILQQAVYFRFDNINWRVLLRSFDVVIDDKSIINVTTACDVRLWPANIEIIENIERSLNKLAK